MPRSETKPKRPFSLQHGCRNLWNKALSSPDRSRRRRLRAATFALVLIVGAVDFWSGVHASLLVFYLLPVSLAVTSVSSRFGVVTAITSVAIWLAGDVAAGAHYSNPWIPAWNALIALVTYLVVIWLLANLTGVHREMEERVTQRTLALTAEMAERKRLENAVLEISEREQRKIGRDLHDGLSQHLVEASTLAKSIEARLVERGAPESSDLSRVIVSIEQGIQQTRSVSKGLLLAEIESGRLVEALGELAAQTGTYPGVACDFTADSGISVDGTSAATHLYRIAREATTNALRHSAARRIEIQLRTQTEGILLSIQDDGVGLPLPCSRPSGLGLRIMAHRADIIGARFKIEALPAGGTRVECLLPKTA